jgi:hypothetical protein
MITIDCKQPYHPELLFGEIQSWLRMEFGREVREDDLSYCHIWDEQGRVRGDETRDPRDGEGYAFLLQAQGSQEDIEEKLHTEDPKSAIQKFIKHTRWRRMKSQYECDFC